MTDSAPMPAVSDSDIAWITDVLGLAPLDEPRRAFLDADSSLDLAACPGSGKTTLVVAKLALLARSWTSRSQGICVLSHTNVARTEIQDRLGGTAVGGELLRYPHYIDTIHGFMNRFLAAPWLHSHGLQVVAIDNEITANVRRKFLGAHDYRTLQNFLDKKHLDFDGMGLVNADLDNPLGDGFPSAPHTNMYKLASSAITDSAKRGYFRHDEMFVVAQALLREQPGVPAALRARFPRVLIDEMQDTDTAQMGLLDQIFPIDAPEISVQRVGDPNQAIFHRKRPDDVSFRPAATTITLANSFRFDSSIAGIASGLANQRVLPDGLVGLRETDEHEAAAQHTVFLFDEERIEQVFDSFAEHVLASFPDETLRRSKVAAIGLVHKPVAADVVAGHKHFPKTVSHYWTNYDHSAKGRASQFDLLIQYVWNARALAQRGASAASVVDSLATGVLRLCETFATDRVRVRSRPHKQLLELINHDAESRRAYLDVVARFALGTETIDDVLWAALAPTLVTIAHRALGTITGPSAPATADFIKWESQPNQINEVIAAADAALPANVKRVEIGGRFVDLTVSSIHAVKGETHLATLVVETFYGAHYLKNLLPWLTGTKSHGEDARSPADHSRLYSAYVALTRATHLLCLAIPSTGLGPGKNVERAEAALRDAGWAVVRIQ
jgi:DNA helicase-2/ATP-dependent DNA helicase PcrA